MCAQLIKVPGLDVPRNVSCHIHMSQVISNDPRNLQGMKSSQNRKAPKNIAPFWKSDCAIKGEFQKTCTHFELWLSSTPENFQNMGLLSSKLYLVFPNCISYLIKVIPLPVDVASHTSLDPHSYCITTNTFTSGENIFRMTSGSITWQKRPPKPIWKSCLFP